MRFFTVLTALLLVFAVIPAASADSDITLDTLRWRHRVLLLPPIEEAPRGADWMVDRRELVERNLVLFRSSAGAYLQWFPEPRSPVVLQLSKNMRAVVQGKVTLIGKDGGVKRQWGAESSDLPAEVFRLVDSMPMRQREMRQSSLKGADLVGTKAKPWSAGPEWAGSEALRLEDLRGRVVVVRFWTDTCPYCTKSLPAMQELAEEFEEEPVTFVGLYHSKPLGSERPWKAAVAHARRLGVTFPIAYDHDWKTLRAWWLDGRGRSATSASFVVAPDGTIAHVHPGPEFFPSDDPAHARANADYEAIRASIRGQLQPAEP